MAEIIWLEPARDDFNEISAYIALDNPDAAAAFVDRVLRHVRQLKEHPRSGSVLPEIPESHYRQIVEPPCRVFYRFDGTTAFILHVLRFERLFRMGRLMDRDPLSDNL
jgi:plasmid stabilization system protein ParE